MKRLFTIALATIGFMFSRVELIAQNLPEIVKYSEADMQKMFNILTQSSDGQSLKMDEILKLKNEVSYDNYLSSKLGLPLLANGNVDFNGKPHNMKTAGLSGITGTAEIAVYPNPAVSQLFIDYELKKDASKVRISLNNLLGNEVQLLSDESNLKPGLYSKVISLSVSQGIYFVVFNIDGETSIQKVAVAK